MRVKQNTISRNPGETLITSPSITVEKKDNMQVTTSDIQIKTKEDTESFGKIKQEQSGNNPPDGGEQKIFVNVKDI